MGETYDFSVTIGTTSSIKRKDAAELLQRTVSDANHRHDDINYVTVQYSKMDEDEIERLLQLIDRYDPDDIELAIESIDALEE